MYRMASQSRCIRFVAPDAGGDSGHMIRGSTMIDKIIGIRRIGWRVQPPKQWRKNKKPHDSGGFDNVLNEELEANVNHEVRICTKVVSTGGTASGEKR